MEYDVRSVVFDLTTEGDDGQFSIPQPVYDLLGLHDGDNLALSIETPAGTYTGIRKLAAGTEILDSDLQDYIKAGQRIKITLSRA